VITIPAITRDAIDEKLEVLQARLACAGDLCAIDIDSDFPSRSKSAIAVMLKAINDCAEDLRIVMRPVAGREIPIQCADDTNKLPWISCDKSNCKFPVHACIYCDHGLHVSKRRAVVLCDYQPAGGEC